LEEEVKIDYQESQGLEIILLNQNLILKEVEVCGESQKRREVKILFKENAVGYLDLPIMVLKVTS
jgi:hypothetical protein